MRVSRSTVVCAVLVLAAGGVAWYGTSRRGEGGSAPAPGPAMTLAAPEAAAAPDGPRMAAGLLPTRVLIESAGIDTPISEVGVVRGGNGLPEWEVAWHSAGHHLDSALPGQPGNMVLTGHVSVADRANAAVFKTLERVSVGDVVTVLAGDTAYRYRIDAVTVKPPSAVSILRSSHEATVTLITCTKDLENRLVVTGTLM